MAARTAPVPSRTGAAIDRMPGASSSSARAQPRARMVHSSSPNARGSRGRKRGSPERLGWASTSASSSGPRAASRTLPCEVYGAGNRVPISTRSVISLGTATRATYTMSEPSSWDMDDDSPVWATSRSRCGRPTSHRPSEATNAIPSDRTRGVSENWPSARRTNPSSSRVSSSRRAVGRARPDDLGDLAQAHPRPLGAEALQHVQPAGQRLDEVGSFATTGHNRLPLASAQRAHA